MGGISGIAAAARLTDHGIETRLLEAEDTLGGRIGTCSQGLLELDLGGRNFSVEDANLTRLLARFGASALEEYRFNSVSVGGPRFDARRGGSPLTRIRRLVSNVMAVGPAGLRKLWKVADGARQAPSGGMIGSPYWVQLAEELADPTAATYFGSRICRSRPASVDPAHDGV